MKKIYIILGVVIIILTTILFTHNKNNGVEYIDYNGVKLAMLVDGKGSTKLPTDNRYYLVRYECTDNTELSWDSATSTLTSENTNVNDTCYLEFESSPNLYNLVNIGDYISYVGDSANECSGNQCSGWNAQQSNTDIYENYGFCDSSGKNKFYTYGWRVLYKNDNSVYIVSAGAPECIVGISNDSEDTKKNLNSAARKYCNTIYVSGGDCTAETTSVHALNGDDFYKFTSQYYGSNNARYLYSYDDGGIYDDTGTKICYNKQAQTYCGYNNSIIENGGNYWFASGYSSDRTIYYNKVTVSATNAAGTNGLRPVIKLDATVKATGGLGTMENPYTISERETE